MQVNQSLQGLFGSCLLWYLESLAVVQKLNYNSLLNKTTLENGGFELSQYINLTL